MSYTINTSNRITGLSSGLETDEILEGLLSRYRAKLDKQEQTTTKLEWTADAYREINTLVKNFRDKHMSMLSDMCMLTSAVYRDMTASVSSDAVSISAAFSAFAGTYTIDEITELASAPKISSTEAFTGTTYSSDTTLEMLSLENAFQFDASNELSFSINGETFTFNKDTTIGEMILAVNKSDAGVTMRYSSLTKGFSLSSDTTGSASKIDIVNISGNAFASADSALGIAEGVDIYKGTDAECVIEGVAVTQSSNTFTYDGITYTLNAKSSTAIEFTVSQDYQSTVDSVVAFVDAYNELVETLQDKIGEKVYKDFDPLTDAQKKDMDEDEIKLWEEKATSGLLHRDSYISSMLTSMRNAFYTTVEGTGMTLADIGLTTSSYLDGDEIVSHGGKITVDEDKLFAAIQENPDTVKNMFMQRSDTDDSSEEGLIIRISDALLNYTDQTTDIALESLEKKIDSSEDQEERLEDQMKAKEESLWAKFSAMEAALSKLNSLSSWLSSLFVS